MSNIWDFLSTLVKSKKKKDSNSVIVKNYINGNNNQTHKSENGSNQSQRPSKTVQDSTKIKNGSPISIQSIRLYSTSKKGKIYTTKFYKSINHNFGIEVILKNNSSQTQKVRLGHCIYDQSGKTIFKGNFNPTIKQHSTLKQSIFVDAKAFSRMKNGKYKSQFWINDKRVQKVYFTVTYK